MQLIRQTILFAIADNKCDSLPSERNWDTYPEARYGESQFYGLPNLYATKNLI